MGQPIATKTKMVFFPGCGKYPIKTGSTKFTEEGQPISRIGDIVDCPSKAKLIKGQSTFTESGMPVSVVGDKALCPSCGIGYVITGANKYTEG